MYTHTDSYSRIVSHWQYLFQGLATAAWTFWGGPSGSFGGARNHHAGALHEFLPSESVEQPADGGLATIDMRGSEKTNQGMICLGFTKEKRVDLGTCFSKL